MLWPAFWGHAHRMCIFYGEITTFHPKVCPLFKIIQWVTISLCCFYYIIHHPFQKCRFLNHTQYFYTRITNHPLCKHFCIMSSFVGFQPCPSLPSMALKVVHDVHLINTMNRRHCIAMMHFIIIVVSLLSNLCCVIYNVTYTIALESCHIFNWCTPWST